MRTYLRHKSLNVLDIKELIALEYLDFEGKYKNYLEQHDFWELCFLEKGNISLSIGGKPEALSEREIILIPPETLHSYASAEGNRSRAFVVCFACSSQAMRSLGGMRFSLREEQLCSLKTIIKEYEQTFRINEEGAMELLSAPAFGGQQAIISQLEYLLICLLRVLAQEREPGIIFLQDDRFYAGLADAIIEYFHQNLDRRLTLKEICRRFNYSSSFICKTFKEQTGQTLFEYFNRLKMEEAKKLLSATEQSIAEIARSLGFAEEKYFGAIFKKLVGLSPSAYRKRRNQR